MFFQNFALWLKQPFSADMDTKHWFLFLGLLLVMMILWRVILTHITEGIS